MEHTSVFTSKIRRQNNDCKELYSLLKVTPAVPKKVNPSNDTICTFKPLTDKLYIPKKKSQLKVKTLGDIRREYEKYVYSYLPNELQKQQQLLYRKIRYGSLRNEDIKTIAKRILNSDDPVSRSAWQMLTNINPEGYAYAKQFILLNGKHILINGSRGGKSRFIYNRNLSKDKATRESKISKNKFDYTKRSLLRNSLHIRFRPGPLTKKKCLDNSYQKYHIGTADIINLPKVGLEVEPTLGLPIPPSVTTILNNLREVDGTISEKWAELSASVLGTIKDSKPVQLNKGDCVTFDLNYNKNLKKILIRQDSSEISKKQYFHNEVISESRFIDDECVIRSVINDILSSVEISLKQDDMYTGEDEPRKTDNIKISAHGTQAKDKLKKKHSGELNRLDVRIIRLNGSEQNLPQCLYNFCALGCVCSSISCTYKLKGHCGRLDCMFECTCDFSNFKAVDLYESDCSEFVPGLLNLDNELNLKLSKEEMKFHQTVIMTDDKRILLKKQKRNWKTSRKYADFYRNMCLKTTLKIDKHLLIVIPKLNIKNVEPWCMVHNLYKCFCKLKFSTTSYPNIEISNKNETEINNGSKVSVSESEPMDISSEPDSMCENFTNAHLSTRSCARIRPYNSIHSVEFYRTTHNKIAEMEKNDTNLQKKLLSKIYNENDDNHKEYCIVDDENEFQNIAPIRDVIYNIPSDEVNSAKVSNKSPSLDVLVDNTHVKSTSSLLSQELPNMSKKRLKTSFFSEDCSIRSFLNMVCSEKDSLELPNKEKLVSWLESSYKQYKNAGNDGWRNVFLGPPKRGQVALYPWEFILNRYKERKNHFLVLKEYPHRIFLTIDTKQEMFKQCVDIDSIRFDDIHKYPNIVKYLLTNASDLKDSFCMLYGLTQCWELFGSIRKSNDSEQSSDNSCDKSKLQVEITNDFPAQNTERVIPENISNENDVSKRDIVLEQNQVSHKTLNMRLRKRKFEAKKKENGDDNTEFSANSTLNYKKTAKLFKESKRTKNENKLQNIVDTDIEIPSKKHVSDNDELLQDSSIVLADYKKTENSNAVGLSNHSDTDMSKWFLMIIENDFNELQFHLRGFFVKYDSVIKSITLSRLSGKTVRLSSQKDAKVVNNVQFGLYATPYTHEHCVFIGPYEKSDLLGIETVKKQCTLTESHTRGIWIKTNKAENVDVIQNPLSFIPTNLLKSKDMVLVSKTPKHNNISNDILKLTSNVSKQDTPKVVKPIKIRKSNQIYYIAPDGMIKELPKNSTNIQLQSPPKVVYVQPPSAVANSPNIISTNTEQTSKLSAIGDTSSLKQLKVFSGQKPVAEIAPQVNKTLKTLQNDSSNKPSLGLKGMSILKPEEINKRAVAQNIVLNRVSPPKCPNDDEMNMDIENFLATTTLCIPQNDDCVILDDDEDDWANLSKDVWIECHNAEHVGWISGRIKKDNSLSFQFPGFNFSEFYEHDKALKKITEVLSRKVHIPDQSAINWKVVHSQEDLKATHKLTSSDLKNFSELTADPKAISLQIITKRCSERSFHRVDFRVGDQLHKGVATFVVNNVDAVEERLETNLVSALKCVSALNKFVLYKANLNKRITVYEAVVRPALLLYGRESWTIKENVKERLMFMEKAVLKALIQPIQFNTNFSVSEVQNMLSTSIIDLISESAVNLSPIDSETSELKTDCEERTQHE